MNILEPFTNTHIKGMAFERAQALAKIERNSRPLVEHTLKRCIYVNAEYYNHWEKEITAMLRDWQDIKIKPKGKRLTYTEYIREINGWFDEPDDLEHLLNSIVKYNRLEKKYIPKYNKSKSFKQIRHLIDALITDVSKGSFIEFNEKNYNIPKHSDLTK